MSFSRPNIKKLTSSRIRLFVLCLHLYGLTPEEKQQLDLAKFYEILHRTKLRDDIYQELRQQIINNELDKNTNITILSRELENSLIQFAHSLTDYELTLFFIKLRNSQILESNVTAVITLINQLRAKAREYLTEYPELKIKAEQAWKHLIFLCENHISFFEELKKIKASNYLITFTILAFIYFMKGFLQNERLSQNGSTEGAFICLMFMSILLSMKYEKQKVSAVFDVKVDLSATDSYLNKAIDQHMQEILQKQSEKREAKNSGIIAPPAKTQTFEEDLALRSDKAVKRKHLTSTSDTDDSSDKEEKIPTFINDKDGTTFYLLNYHRKKATFYHHNESKLSQITKIAGIKDETTIDQLVAKAQTGGSIGRVLPSNTDKWGFVFVSKKERKKFPSGIKLRFRHDLRIELAYRQPTDHEAKLGIKEVVSPVLGKSH